jgi:hypothetical protein
MINSKSTKKVWTCRRGFALAELLVSVGIIVLIVLAIGNFNADIFFLNSVVDSSLKAQLDARRVLRTIIAELRSVSPSSLGAYPITTSATNTLIFYSNIDSDQNKERLRYFQQGSELKRGVLEPTGSPLVYNPVNEQVETLIHDLISTTTPIFDYFTQNYTGTSSPLTPPVDPLLVRLIRVTFTIDEDPNRPPSAITVTSQGTLRNLKDNL